MGSFHLPAILRSAHQCSEIHSIDRVAKSLVAPLPFGTLCDLASWRRHWEKTIMRALCWHGKGDVRVDTVPDPKIQHPRDAVIKITACAICGSDLHLLDGYQPTMESGDILGHENMGEVIELGSEVTNLKIGDRVVVPFTISCGQCWFCQKGLFSCCDRTNPNAEMAAQAMGQSPAGLFGFSHMLGGYSGGQAEYLRVPMADVGPIKIPNSVTDEQALFLSDIFPTGYMAAVNA
jgi:threonine dehydrogenase-like Zn-dependent dehydrogenase